MTKLIFQHYIYIPTLPKSIVDEIQDSAKLLVGKVHKYNEDVFYVPNKDNETHPQSSVYTKYL